jgi:hypothetical protein
MIFLILVFKNILSVIAENIDGEEICIELLKVAATFAQSS